MKVKHRSPELEKAWPLKEAMGGRSSTIAIWLVLLCYGLIFGENVINVGRDAADMTKFYLVGRISPYDVAMMLLLGWGGANWPTIRAMFLRPAVIAIFALLVFAAVGGSIRYGFGKSYVLFDARMYMSLFGGMILGKAMQCRGLLVLYTSLFCLVVCGLLVYAGSAVGAYGTRFDRITDANIYYYWNLLLIPSVLLGAFAAGRFSISGLVFWLSFAALVAFGVFITETRSCLFTLAIAAAALVSLWWEKLRRYGKLIAVVGAVGLGLVAVVKKDSMQHMLYDGYSLGIAERMRGLNERDDNVEVRIEEVRVLLHEMSVSDYMLGKGLGATITSVLEHLDVVPGLHIAVFNVLLKFGLAPFVAFVVFTYIVIPLRFIRELYNRRRGANGPRNTAILVCYPAVGTLSCLMLMSGGFADITLLWVGITFAVYDTLKAQPHMRMEATKSTGGPRRRP